MSMHVNSLPVDNDVTTPSSSKTIGTRTGSWAKKSGPTCQVEQEQQLFRRGLNLQNQSS